MCLTFTGHKQSGLNDSKLKNYASLYFDKHNIIVPCVEHILSCGYSSMTQAQKTEFKLSSNQEDRVSHEIQITNLYYSFNPCVAFGSI